VTADVQFEPNDSYQTEHVDQRHNALDLYLGRFVLIVTVVWSMPSEDVVVFLSLSRQVCIK
jgi:hypothetical protein